MNGSRSDDAAAAIDRSLYPIKFGEATGYVATPAGRIASRVRELEERIFCWTVRWKGLHNDADIERELTIGEAAYARLIETALGDPGPLGHDAAKFLIERRFGKAKQPIEITEGFDPTDVIADALARHRAAEAQRAMALPPADSGVNQDGRDDDGADGDGAE